ncbi:MAG TPA: FecR family protein [Sedimentisphaerales bacterium]|nr:FecR family protein [Sedimentisphaerales bacterium]
MNQKKDEKWLDELIFRAVDSGKLEFDAEKWKQKHPEEFKILCSRPRQGRATRQAAIWMFIRSSPITKLAAAVTAAAAVIAASLIWFSPPKPAAVVGQVSNLYGIVTLNNGGLPEKVLETTDVLAGQWVEVLSGSRAGILLKDQSRLSPEPRTAFQVNARKHGLEILLERGAIAIEAAKQPPGKSLTIKTDGSRIRVFGTRLDVRLVRKPDGSRRTRVRVASGSVELQSSGKKVLLLPNTEGIADEGQEPVRRSANLEVSEMTRLFDKSKELAAQSNVKAGLPVIIDFMGGSSATVWTVVASEKLQAADADRYLLRLKHPAFGVEAFTLDGAALDVDAKGNVLQIDLADALEKSAPAGHLILKIPNVQGLFRAEEEGIFQFDSPPCAAPVVTLFQFRLPEGAYVDEASPEIIEREKKLNKLVVTVAANSQMPEVCY